MTNVTERSKLISEVTMMMGAPVIDLELEPEQLNLAVDIAINRYRQRSTNSLEESFLFIDCQPDVQVYTLPPEVQEVRTIYRRSTGGGGGGAGGQIDPFSLAWANNIYMLNNPGGMGGSGSGMLATFDFAMQFQSLAGRMFGRDLMYSWDTATKRLTLHRRFTAVDQVCCHIYNARPETILLIDVYARPWIRSYSIAQAKMMIGEIRSKFGNFAGPQGGITMNGPQMKDEAKQEMEKLDMELSKMVDSHDGMPFCIG